MCVIERTNCFPVTERKIMVILKIERKNKGWLGH